MHVCPYPMPRICLFTINMNWTISSNWVCYYFSKKVERQIPPSLFLRHWQCQCLLDWWPSQAKQVQIHPLAYGLKIFSQHCSSSHGRGPCSVLMQLTCILMMLEPSPHHGSIILSSSAQLSSISMTIYLPLIHPNVNGLSKKLTVLDIVICSHPTWP